MATKPKKLPNGRWHVDFYPAGRYGPRVRQTFDKKVDADQFIIVEKGKARLAQSTYVPPVNDRRRLSDLAAEWYKLFGCNLKDNTRTYTRLNTTIDRLGNPLATSFRAIDWMNYANLRIQHKYKKTGRLISNNTVNHEQHFLSAVFSKLQTVGLWTQGNPLSGVKPLKIEEPDLIYLSKQQIKDLLKTCKESQSPDLLIWVELGLNTGARWSEITNLTAFQIRNGFVHFIHTKSRKNRMVPISPELAERVLKGRDKSSRLFKNPRKGFITALKNADIILPRGQFTHILRHTFASWYIINGGDIRRLQEILGHSTVKMTERYTQLKPKHLNDALLKNPIATLFDDIENG